VVTVTSTVPAVPAGEVTKSWLAVSEVITPVPAPKWTALVDERFEPELVTEVPPLVGPLAGLTPATTGAGVGVLQVTMTGLESAGC
jgi:hypothetical protein